MAARVNSRFVVILAVVLVVAFGAVALVGLKMLRKTSEQLAALGDQAMVAGNYKQAALHYSKAVNKDQQNPDLIRKWLGAIEKENPEQPQEYQDVYTHSYVVATRALADVLRTDVEAHRRVLEQTYRANIISNSGAAAWKAAADDADRAIRMFPDNDPKAKTLARYRAMANLNALRQDVSADASKFEEPRRDFLTALEADPGDADAAAGLCDLDRTIAAHALLERDDAEAQRRIEAARKTITEFLDKHPESPVGLLALLNFERGETARKAKAENKAVNSLAENAPLAKRLFDAVIKAPAASLSVFTVVEAANLAVRLPEPDLGSALAMIDHSLEANPDHPILLKSRADVQATAGKLDDAVAGYQRLIDLPGRPISLEGLIVSSARNSAMASQMATVLAQYQKAATPADRKAGLERAKQLKARIADRLGDKAPVVQLADAQIKYGENDIPGARIALTRYIDGEGSNDAIANALLAEILIRSNETGEAKRRLERLLELSPNNAQAHVMLASMAIQSGDTGSAERHLAAAAQIDPGNKEIESLHRTALQINDPKQNIDPVLKRMMQFSERTGGARETAAAIEDLKKLLAEYPGDIRIISVLTQFMVNNKDRAGAQALVETELAKAPDSKALQQLKQGLQYENPMDAYLANIEAMDAPPIQKHLSRAVLYITAKQTDKAWESLEEARKIDPENSQVIELTFVKALQDKAFDQAAAIADKATARNIDRLNGLSYIGRLRMAQEKFEEAATAFERAAEIDRLNSDVWRNLGSCRLLLKQYDRAITAYERALDSRPNDAVSVRGLIAATHSAGRLDDALAAARNGRRAGVGLADAELTNIWLQLEAAAPSGNKATALEGRRQMAVARPDDRPNKLAMTGLLIELQRYDEARKVLDELKKAPGDDRAALTDLEALWYIRKGDLVSATRLFSDYINSVPEASRTDEPYMRRAAMLASPEIAQYDEAIKALQEGMKYQDKKAMSAERQLAGLYLQTHRPQEALATLRHILDSVKDDPGNALLKGIIQCQLDLKMYAEAESTINQLGEAVKRDPALLMLAADAAARQNRLPEARSLLDQAVQAAPSEPMWYYIRSQFVRIHDRERIADAEADLKAALERDPHFAPARESLFGLYMVTGRPDEAVGLLRDAVAGDPDNDRIRAMLVDVLIRRQQAKSAADAVAEAIRRKPDSLDWLYRSCDVFIKAGNADQAVPYLKHAWDMSKTPPIALAYAEILAQSKAKDLQLARTVLSDPAIDPDKNLQVLIARARIYHLAGKEQESEGDLGAAFRLLNQGEPEQVGLLFAALRQVYPTQKERIRVLDRLKTVGAFKDWMDLQDAGMRSETKEFRDQGWPRLQAIAAQDEKKDQALAAANLMAGLCASERRFEEAATHFKRAIELDPGQAELLNNYAYVVGEELKRPQDALEYAEKAAALAPTTVGIADTLGTLQMRLNQVEKADATFNRALNTATNLVEKAPVYLHLAELRLLQNNRADARRYADLLEEIFRNPEVGANLKTTYGTGLDEVKKKIDASS